MYMYALFVTCPFKLFSQTWNVWYDYGDVFVLPVDIVVPVVVVGSIICLIVVAVMVVFKLKMLLQPV